MTKPELIQSIMKAMNVKGEWNCIKYMKDNTIIENSAIYSAEFTMA
jgi:hypothetical protein